MRHRHGAMAVAALLRQVAQAGTVRRVTSYATSRRREGGPYHHGDVRGAGVAAALELLDGEGPDAVTMTRVAAAVGVTRPALNRPFRDIQGLRDAVAAACLEDLEAAMRTAARAADDPAAAFRAVGEAYLAWARAHPRRYAFLFSVDPSAAPLPDLRRVLLEDAGEPVPSAFALGAPEASSPRADGIPDAAYFSWSAMHGLAMLLAAGPLADVDPARQDAIIRVVMQGIGAAFGMAPPLRSPGAPADPESTAPPDRPTPRRRRTTKERP